MVQDPARTWNAITDVRVDGAEIMRRTGIEGVEWVLFLGGPRDLSHGAWHIFSSFDVQRKQDGTVVVVDRYKNAILLHSEPENYGVNLSRLEQTLEDFRENVKDAFDVFTTLTGGRTGTLNDKEGRLAPKLASDAGPAGLTDFLVRTRLIEGDAGTASPSAWRKRPEPRWIADQRHHRHQDRRRRCGSRRPGRQGHPRVRARRRAHGHGDG